MTYPISHIHAQDTLIIAQISDLHLDENIHSSHYHHFLKILEKACKLQPDLLILTGDLVNNGKKHVYDWLFDTLTQTNIDFVCIAGNHDVTLEKNTHLDFEKRIFLPKKADKRLLNRHIITLQLTYQTWQIILLDSTQTGQIYGGFSQTTLDWLDTTLTQSNLPTLIFFHHHPLAVGSLWIDEYMLQNQSQFWQIINQHAQVKAIFCGHVHQAQQIQTPASHSCMLYTAPATSRQFLPHHDDFALDDKSAGFRLIAVQNNHFRTEVYRL